MLFIHSSLHAYLDCFHFVTTVNNADMNMAVQISVQVPTFNPLQYIPGSEIAVSGSNAMLNCLRNHHTGSHSCCTISHSHHHCARFQSLHILPDTCYVYRHN